MSTSRLRLLSLRSLVAAHALLVAALAPACTPARSLGRDGGLLTDGPPATADLGATDLAGGVDLAQISPPPDLAHGPDLAPPPRLLDRIGGCPDVLFLGGSPAFVDDFNDPSSFAARWGKSYVVP